MDLQASEKCLLAAVNAWVTSLLKYLVPGYGKPRRQWIGSNGNVVSNRWSKNLTTVYQRGCTCTDFQKIWYRVPVSQLHLQHNVGMSGLHA